MTAVNLKLEVDKLTSRIDTQAKIIDDQKVYIENLMKTEGEMYSVIKDLSFAVSHLITLYFVEREGEVKDFFETSLLREKLDSLEEDIKKLHFKPRPTLVASLR